MYEEVYFELIVYTIGLWSLSLLLAYKNKSLDALLLMGFFYYWSLHGAYTLVKPEPQRSVLRLASEIIEFHLNVNYLDSIRIYSLFILVVLLTYGYLSNAGASRPESSSPTQPHNAADDYSELASALLLLASSGTTAMCVAYFYRLASSSGSTAYLMAAETGGAIRSLQQFSTCAAAVAAVLWIHRVGLFQRQGNHNPAAIIPLTKTLFFSTMMLIVFAANMVLGARGTLLGFGLTVYLTLAQLGYRLPRKIQLLLIPATFLAGMGAIIRGYPVELILEVISSGDWDLISAYYGGSNMAEKIAAHLSMYAVLQTGGEPIGAPLLLSLLGSIIPASLAGSSLAPSIYSQYADLLQLSPDRGFTLHIATSFYMFLGSPGVILGALILGIIIASPNQIARMQFAARARGPWKELCASSLIAYLPALIRTGFDGLKGYLQFAVLLPVLLIWLVHHPIWSQWERKKELPPS